MVVDSENILIGLSGKASSGKTTFAQYLVENYGFVRVSFAEVLKREIIEDLIACNTAFTLHGFFGSPTEKNQTLFTHYDKEISYRKFMQQFGDAKRATDPDYFITQLFSDLPSGRVIIDDSTI